jgi:hypothetical protein
LNKASYLSRFFAKFVEIIAAGLATAVSAYLVAHLAGPLSATLPTPAAVSAAPTALDASKVQPASLVTAAIEAPRSPAQPVTDAPPAQPARKAAISGPVPVPKDIKDSTSAARGERSAEALARAALANLDAERSAPADVPGRRAASVTGSAPPAPVAVKAALPRIAPVDPPTVDPLPPASSSPLETAAPRAEPAADADEVNGLLSVPKRLLHLLRPGSPSLAREAPRPPMPVAAIPRG